MIKLVNNISDSNKITCIYKILNQENNKIYIGQTVNLINRLYLHNKHLKLNKHDNPILQRSFNKNSEKFIIEPLEICERNQLKNQEEYWIDYYNSRDKRIGYNINPAQDQDINKKSRKPLLKFDLEGNLVKEYESIIEAVRTENIDSAALHKAMNLYGNRKTCKGHIWIRKEDYNGNINLEKYKRNWSKENLKIRIPIIQYNLQYKFIKEWDSQTTASKTLKIHIGAINSCCKGRYKTAGKFIFKYKKSNGTQI